MKTCDCHKKIEELEMLVKVYRQSSAAADQRLTLLVDQITELLRLYTRCKPKKF
jgi:hypothetical protein